jgi:hypothetical protein
MADLSRISDMLVISRNSAFTYQDQAGPGAARQSETNHSRPDARQRRDEAPARSCCWHWRILSVTVTTNHPKQISDPHEGWGNP